LRVTKVIDSDKEDDIVPKHNARLAAKNKFREPKPEAQARKVMMKRLGFETATELPDQASFEPSRAAQMIRSICQLPAPSGAGECDR